MNVQLSGTDTGLSLRPALIGGMRLRVFECFEDAGDVWRLLEVAGVTTVYQSYAWCKAWHQRIGLTKGSVPCLVVGEDVFGVPCFLLPLQLRTRFGLRVIEVMASPQAAYGFGLFSEEFLSTDGCNWFTDCFADLVAALPRHDVFHLQNLPESIFGYRNPLLGDRSFASANVSHSVQLNADFHTFMSAKRSPESLRSIRKRDANLLALGDLKFELPTLVSEQVATLDIMFEQQAQRLAEFGIRDLYPNLEREFIKDLATVRIGKTPLLRPYRLTLDGRVLAVMLGAHFANTYWALISSLAEGVERRLSPGDYALRALFSDLCKDGTERLDFSVGDSAYKHHWSDHTAALHFIVRASSLGGVMLALYLLLREKLKRFAKQTPVISSILMAARRFMAGKR
jgi:CelD/BcsL family acetyltransferase involved in cellulose biosynthesis